MTVKMLSINIYRVATLIGVATYLFWGLTIDESGKSFFYIGNALFISLLALAFYLQNKKYFIAFFTLCLTINNLLDEIFFDPTKLQISELLILGFIPLLWWYYADKKGD